MSNSDKIVDSIISQIQLAITVKQKGYIGVFTAKQNLNPVIELFITRINERYQINTTCLTDVQNFLKASGLRVDIWQKPDPFNDCNHLTLTVGAFTAIIFDYEESQ